MARIWLAVIVVAMLITSGAPAAHHSYSAYEQTAIELEGVIGDMQWVNPHVLLTLKSADATYTLEWRAVSAIARVTDAREVLRTGDRVVVTGRPRFDIAETGVMLLQSIRRPADGWSWPAT
jgi:hypothetical protein